MGAVCGCGLKAAPRHQRAEWAEWAVLPVPSAPAHYATAKFEAWGMPGLRHGNGVGMVLGMKDRWKMEVQPEQGALEKGVGKRK